MKAVRTFKDKGRARAWIARCRREISGCNYGTVYAAGHGGNYRAYVSGEMTEDDVRACTPANATIKFE